jgi:hypothetical protein
MKKLPFFWSSSKTNNMPIYCRFLSFSDHLFYIKIYDLLSQSIKACAEWHQRTIYLLSMVGRGEWYYRQIGQLAINDDERRKAYEQTMAQPDPVNIITRARVR